MVAACPTYGCSLSHLWLQVTDHATLGEEPERPDVLISGALHGDEQVGPVTTIVRVRVRARVRVRVRDRVRVRFRDRVRVRVRVRARARARVRVRARVRARVRNASALPSSSHCIVISRFLYRPSKRPMPKALWMT